VIRRIVNDVLAPLDGELAKNLCRQRAAIDSTRTVAAGAGAAGVLHDPLRALLLQAFYTIRSEAQLMEQLHYNLLYRWFAGLEVDEPVWVPTVLSANCWKRRLRTSSRPNF
jgi:hypothetical protein